jgi:hypothetical protein
MPGWLLTALVAWCAASIGTAIGIGWLLRRYPPQPWGDNAPDEQGARLDDSSL